MNLENELKRALQVGRPDPGFAVRVMKRIEEAPAAARPGVTWWRAAAASLALTALLGGYATHRIVEQRRGERAKEQVIAAMRIAGEKVRIAQQEVREIGSHD